MEKTCAPESGTSSEENASGAAHRQGGEIMNHTECQFKWLMSQPDRGPWIPRNHDFNDFNTP